MGKAARPGALRGLLRVPQTQREAFARKRSEDRNVPKGSLLLGLIVDEELGIVNSLCKGPMAVLELRQVQAGGGQDKARVSRYGVHARVRPTLSAFLAHLATHTVSQSQHWSTQLAREDKVCHLHKQPVEGSSAPPRHQVARA